MYPEKYQVDLTFDEIALIRSAVFKKAGDTIEDFNSPHNSKLRELWMRLTQIIAPESRSRFAAEECAQWGSD